MSTLRMYENKYPEVDDIVMVKVNTVDDTGAHVSLLEYGDIEGMILLSEISRKRVVKVHNLIREGTLEVVMVVRVNPERGYIDLSKKRISADDIAEMNDKWNKSKIVHSIMQYVCKKQEIDTLQLYQEFGWPLYEKYDHAYNAFELIFHEADNEANGVFSDFPDLPTNVKDELGDIIRKRIAPKYEIIRADIELTCFSYEGIDGIKYALKEGIRVAELNPDYSFSIKLVASPLYTISCMSDKKKECIAYMNEICNAIRRAIEEKGGNMLIIHEARVIANEDEKSKSK